MVQTKVGRRIALSLFMLASVDIAQAGDGDSSPDVSTASQAPDYPNKPSQSIQVAQNVSPPGPPSTKNGVTADSPATSSASSDQSGEISELVVTGSRLITNGAQSPTPVTVLTAEELTEKVPSNLPDALNQLPQFQNSSGPERSISPLTALSQTSSPITGNFLNLRGLGPNRSLILLDGERVPPTDAKGQVDTDILPQLLVQRVDVVTGGASAVYGSDAVVGVINFVLNKNYNGLELIAQKGISTYGDDSSYRVGALGGTSFMDGKLHIEGSVEHYDSDGISGMGSRPNGANLFCNIGQGTAASPYQLKSNCRFLANGEGGEITSGPLAGNIFAANGTLTPLNPGNPVGVGGNGENLGTDWTLGVPLETTQEFGRISYELTPDLTMHVQLSASEVVDGPFQSAPEGFYSGGTAITIFSGNAFLNPTVQSRLGPGQSFTMSEDFNPQVAQAVGGSTFPHQLVKETDNATIASVGLDGKLWSDWTWTSNYSHGQSDETSTSSEVQMNKFTAAVDAVYNGSGQIVCRVTLTNPGLYPGCVPLNVFGDVNVSQAAINYVTGISRYDIHNSTDIVDANAHGTLLSLWDRDLKVSVGGEYRKQSLLETSNANPAIPVDTTGLRGAGPEIPHFDLTNAGIANGSVNVKEGFGEFFLPLFKDLPLISSLDLTGAARYTDYSTSGPVTTWKIGGSYSPVSELRIRGTVSRDIRAPSLMDLYAGQQGSVLLVTDPHTGVSQVTNSFTTANPSLKPERGLTDTVGFVYQPNWLQGFAFSLDAYDITISDAIYTPAFQDILTQCQESGGTGPTCALIVRPLPYSNTSAANFPTAIYSSPLNISKLQQKGIDIDISGGIRAGDIYSALPGSFTIRILASYVPVDDNYLTATTPVEKTAGYFGNPRLRGSLQVGYDDDPWHVFVQERFTGSYQLSSYAGQYVYANDERAPNVSYTDLTISHTFDQRKGRIFLTVNNVFNALPPVFVVNNGLPGFVYPTNAATYDVVGRYFTLGARFKF